MIDAPSKYCTRCGETKPLNEYHKDRSKRDGHCAYCKPCVIAYVRKYQKDNPDLCAEQGHPGVTYHPQMDRTWCLCGDVIRDGNHFTHAACCGGPLEERAS